jgi:uncharacterized protein (DUF885 family)
MQTRREAILATASAAALAPFAARAAEMQPVSTAEGGRLNTLFDALFQEDLRRNPESATQLGLDKGVNADLKSKLRDESSAGIAAGRALNADQLKRLKTIDRAALSASERVNYDTVLYTRETSVAVSRFDFGGGGFGPGPYVVSQLTGSYQSTPDFLDTKHRVEDAEGADAYMARLSGFAEQLDQNTARQRHDAGLGVIPPDFLLDTTLTQLQALVTPADQSLLVRSIARRATAKGLGDSYEANATLIYDEQIRPALERQIAQTRSLRARATHDAGVWARHDGEGFYRAALRATTTTAMSPEEVHKLGLDQKAEISARMDVLLKAQGLTKGTIGQRIQALYNDPSVFFANTDAGRAEAIAYCNGRLDAVRPRLPRVFKRLPPYAFEVRRVPPATEAGAASAFSQGPALDGSRPGLVYINLHDTHEWPRWSLPTVTFHEGLPGHQLEGGLALSNKSLPLIRKAMGFSGYAEGWALYAEQLADELGMYEDDPVGRIGYLRGQLFRACRCVVDTGIHHLRWSKEQAVAYFVDEDGDAPGYATREVERYCAQPGQACSYKIGHTTWVRARERAKTALGPRYDIKDFHEAGLGCGRVPLEILNGVIDGYIAGAKA